VILEQPGTKKREMLAENAQIFLKNLQVVMPGFADNCQ